MSDKLQLIRKEFPPPDGYRYKFPQDGVTVKCNSYGGWQQKMKDHARWNNYPVPTLEDAEDQLCRILPPGLCQYGDGSVPAYFIDARISVTDVLRGTRVLASWMASGMPLVERSVAEERAKICSACYANLPIAGCAPCVGLASLVEEVVALNKLEADPQLEGKMCAYCHCASRANVWVPIEISRSGVSQEVMNQAGDFCWKKNALNELIASESR